MYKFFWRKKIIEFVKAVVLTLMVVFAAEVVTIERALAQGNDRELARETFDKGRALFDAGDYSAALESFRQSLAAFPHFRTIFNMALCAENLGDLPLAIEFYTHYVNWPSEVPKREEILAKLDELKQRLPKKEKSETDTELPGERGEPQTKDAKGGEHELETIQKDQEIRRDAELEKRNLAVPGWIALGTGAAGIVAGTVLLFVAHSKSEEMRAIEDGEDFYNPDTDEAIREQGIALERAGWITGGVGLAAAGIGMALLIVDAVREKRSEMETVAFRPQVNGPARAGLSWCF